MKLGIMQPYFFPYLGYFDLINSVDKWIVFDTAQYIYHGWINRNRIMHPKEGWQYIIAPLKKHSHNTQIMNIEIANDQNWQQRILGQVLHYKKKAPYFNQALKLVKDCISVNEIPISKLNTHILEKCCKALDIKFDHCFFSEMDVEFAPIKTPGDWALRISEALGASEYINPLGGIELFDPKKFEEHNIKLTIRKFENIKYECGNCEFIPDLSIIDVLMWNPANRIKEYLDTWNKYDKN